MNFIFTSESVSEGHPDKICDQISDLIVDCYLSKDPQARVAAETLVTKGKLIIAGEVKSHVNIDTDEIIHLTREKINQIGYKTGAFAGDNVEIEVRLHEQSPDIALGVDESSVKEEGAGDQGIMFGFACNETEVLMPAPIYYAHKILRKIFENIKSGNLQGLGPDAKSQVSIVYENGVPIKAKSVLISIQHDARYSQADVKNLIKPYVISAFPSVDYMCADENFYVNPTGRFTIGGPEADTGLTGRKIIIDTYGGAAPHGGGAFSGKDPTKVDRSAAYMARFIAKNIVASKIADKCTIQIAYAIGMSEPFSFYVNTHGTGKIEDKILISELPKIISLKPKSIREYLKLNRPFYCKTATYGHFGRPMEEDGCFSWESLSLLESLKKLY